MARGLTRWWPPQRVKAYAADNGHWDLVDRGGVVQMQVESYDQALSDAKLWKWNIEPSDLRGFYRVKTHEQAMARDQIERVKKRR